jgi:hypothetical protein
MGLLMYASGLPILLRGLDSRPHRSGSVVGSPLEGVGRKVGVDLGGSPRSMTDVLAGDFEGHPTRYIPADDVVPEVVEA